MYGVTMPHHTTQQLIVFHRFPLKLIFKLINYSNIPLNKVYFALKIEFFQGFFSTLTLYNYMAWC